MSKLLLSLGHNASSILVDRGRIVAGFEEERLSKIKADSSFPAQSMRALERAHPAEFGEITDVYVSHWFPDGELPTAPTKYYDPRYFATELPGARVRAVGAAFTHHDAHAWSAVVFAGPSFPRDNTAVVVADGFGNLGETTSTYRLNSAGEPELVRRCCGYETSLGLMYQYATAFLGLRENQDEYKLLGYEAHIGSHASDQTIRAVTELAVEDGDAHLRAMDESGPLRPGDAALATDTLPALRAKYGQHYQGVLDRLGLSGDMSEDARRAIIAYYVQTRMEHAMTSLVAGLAASNLLLVGGLFMNVKLNNVLSRMVDKISIMPLAGDQGAAIGLYQSIENDLAWPDHLFWGTRELREIPGDRLEYFTDVGAATDRIVHHLGERRIVNVVTGRMEFGARALGHTTTLALPLLENVDYINKLNGRSTIMPMAPIVTRRSATRLFADVAKVHKSLEYMICTRDYAEFGQHLRGAAHTVPVADPKMQTDYTGRPQIVDEDHYLHDVLVEMPDEVLINTSFNEHGMPILFSPEDVKRCHEFQVANDADDRVRTLIINSPARD